MHSLRVAAAGNGTAGVASAVFKAADYSPPLPSGTFTLRAVFDPPDGAWQKKCAQPMFDAVSVYMLVEVLARYMMLQFFDRMLHA